MKDYKYQTVFNYQVSYFMMRIFTLYWLWEQIQIFNINAQRPAEFYTPSVWLQHLAVPTMPSYSYYYALCLALLGCLVVSFFRQRMYLNILVLVLVSLVGVVNAGYNGMRHTNHLLILYYFLSLFLLPNRLSPRDYRNVQYLNLGLLTTYSLAGMWKLLSVVKHEVLNTPELSWIDTNAAKVNSWYNYYMIDQPLPEWMLTLYSYEGFWILLTVVGIILQSLCFLGAFSRKYLTFTLIFLLSFHFYTKYFIIADLKSMKLGLVFLFFPYHIFYRQFQHWACFRTDNFVKEL
ncbi:hypothetical protein [Riemerella columbina]|uniref:hypothetical protein n=1 Tax=Riemerella columbina TaxID=103810 RepID=UPI0026709255|nr:hypothetical protein [Riemerella columbina]WKS96007.1 hypothetical protein NYR17_04540 [Riemerella columbina]